jgi:YVTN family beta-propeller protein
VKRIRVGVNVGDVAYAFGSVWATNNYDGKVVRIDPSTNKIVATIATGGAPTNFYATADTLWVGSNDAAGQNVFRIDPATNTSTAVPVGHAAPSGIVATAGAIWIAASDDELIRLDPATNGVVATVKLGKGAQQGDVAPDGTIWVPNLQSNTISVVDPATNAVVRTVKTGAGPFVVRKGFGDLWVGSFRGSDLWRIRP